MQVLPTILSTLSLSLLTFQFVICVYVMFSSDCSQVILSLFNWTMVLSVVVLQAEIRFFLQQNVPCPGTKYWNVLSDQLSFLFGSFSYFLHDFLGDDLCCLQSLISLLWGPVLCM